MQDTVYVVVARNLETGNLIFVQAFSRQSDADLITESGPEDQLRTLHKLSVLGAPRTVNVGGIEITEV